MIKAMIVDTVVVIQVTNSSIDKSERDSHG